MQFLCISRQAFLWVTLTKVTFHFLYEEIYTRHIERLEKFSLEFYTRWYQSFVFVQSSAEERESVLMDALVTRAASCIIDPFGELAPISTPLGLLFSIYCHTNKGNLCSLLVWYQHTEPEEYRGGGRAASDRLDMTSALVSCYLVEPMIHDERLPNFDRYSHSTNSGSSRWILKSTKRIVCWVTWAFRSWENMTLSLPMISTDMFRQN